MTRPGMEDSVILRAGSNLVARSRYYVGREAMSMRMLAHVFFTVAGNHTYFSGRARGVPSGPRGKLINYHVTHDRNNGPEFYESVTNASA